MPAPHTPEESWSGWILSQCSRPRIDAFSEFGGAPEPRFDALIVIGLLSVIWLVRTPANGRRIFRAVLGRVFLLAGVLVTLPAIAQLTVNPFGRASESAVPGTGFGNTTPLGVSRSRRW